MMRRGGFTLIELLVSTAVFLVMIGAVTTMAHLAAVEAGRSKALIGATTLAQSRIELARNSPYDSVGTIGGIPEGDILATEVVTVGELTYTIKTSVVYIDDPFDEVTPSDTSPTDYKRIRVEVSWGGVYGSNKPVVLITDMAPKSMETEDGMGTLAVKVINASGEAVSGASVRFEAPDIEPPVDTTLLTDDEGQIILPGALPGNEAYEVSVTKSGFTSDRTYGRDEVTNPKKPHLNVFAGLVTEATFTIDLPSTVTFKAVRSREFGFTPFQGVSFRLHGNREIGRTEAEEPVYKTDMMVVTGSNGLVTKTGLEWDTYVVDILDGSSVDLAASTPFTPFSLAPGVSTNFTLVVTSNTANTILFRIEDNLLNPIASASVELKNDLVSYLATQSTGVGGDPDRAQTFFTNLPTTDTPYWLKISASGYEITNSEATISGDVVEDYILNPL